MICWNFRLLSLNCLFVSVLSIFILCILGLYVICAYSFTFKDLTNQYVYILPLRSLLNSAVATGLEEVSFHSNPNERQCQRVFKLHNYCTTAFITHTNKVRFQILQARLQQYVIWEIPDVQAGFRKGRGTRNQITNICWITEKAREFQNSIYVCFIDFKG